MDVKFLIAITEASEAAKGKLALITKVRSAMEVTCNHWMLTDEDLRFKAAIAGAITACDSDQEKEILVKEMKALNALSALFSGIPVDFSRVDMPKNPIGLLKLWSDIKEKK